MSWMEYLLNNSPFLWLPFLIPLLFFIAAVFLLRTYMKIYNKAQSDPDKALNSVLSFAKKVGINTSDVIEFRNFIIGEKLEDFGIIECRKYYSKIIKYTAFLCQTEEEKQIVLRITDKIDNSRLIDLFMSPDLGVIYCPLGQGACKELLNILGVNEKAFLNEAAKADATFKLFATMKRNYWGRLKNIFLRWLSFQSLRYFGTVDEVTKFLPLKSGKRALWFQRIDAYIGKEYIAKGKNEILFVLKFRAKLIAKGFRSKFLSPAVFNYKLYYPFGASGRESLRKALRYYIHNTAF